MPESVHGSRLHVLLAVLAVGLVASAPAAARALKPGQTGAERRVVDAGFETSLAGWQGYNATIASVGGGAVGKRAARVTLTGKGGDFSVVSAPAPVTATKRGTAYRAQAFVRGVPGRSLCMRVREWGSSDVVGSGQSCVTGTASWKPLPDVSYTARGDGHTLDLFVYELPARPGDSFD